MKGLPISTESITTYEADILLVGESASNLEEVRCSLARVRHERVAGHPQAGLDSWTAAGVKPTHLPQLSVVELDPPCSMRAAVHDRMKLVKNEDAEDELLLGADLASSLLDLVRAAERDALTKFGRE